VGVAVGVGVGVLVGAGDGVGVVPATVTLGVDPVAPPQADRARAARMEALRPDERRARESMPKNMDEMM